MRTSELRHSLVRFSRKFFGWPPEAPPYEVKRDFITRKGRENNLGVFVETGTFKGEMLDAQLGSFKRLISIELSDELYRAACKHFSGSPKIELVCGDSGVKLAEVVKSVNEPALFWLDAHYSVGITAGSGSDAPIFKELSCLAGRKFRDIILIDDARLFGFDLGYPSVKKIRKFVANSWGNYSVKVESDIICIEPGKSA